MYENDGKRDIIPALFVDGHGSCFDPGVLKCICDKNHKWTVVFSVPYWISLCLVGDLTEHNITLKIYLVNANNEILTFWIENMIGEMELITTDIRLGGKLFAEL